MPISYTTTIASLRILVQDNDVPYDMNDALIQNVIDRHSHTVFQSKLFKVHTSGLIFRSLVSNWLEVVGIYDSNDNSVTVSTTDATKGIFTFSTVQSDLYIHGTFCNLYAIASELCTILIAKLRKEYSFSNETGNYSRNERIETLKELAQHYAGKALIFNTPNDYLIKSYDNGSVY